MAPALVPMVLLGIAEGIADHDREMVKLGAQYLEMLPEKKSGPLSAVQINLGEQGKKIETRGVYFEGLLRKVAAKEETGALPEATEESSGETGSN